jgi:hypothetical protein
MKMSKEKGVILILAVLLALAIGYIAVAKYNEARLEKQTEIFNEGFKSGYEQAVVQLMQQASTCQEVPIFNKNVTISLIAVKCLNLNNSLGNLSS